jgi:hypothetical protein
MRLGHPSRLSWKPLAGGGRLVESPKLVQPVTGPCSRAFGNDCSITVVMWIPTRAREFALSWPRSSRGGVSSRELRYESPRSVGRINQPESMDPRACSRKPFLADSPRFMGWRSLDRSCPTSNALCRCARTARATPNRASSFGAVPTVASDAAPIPLTGVPRAGLAHSG